MYFSFNTAPVVCKVEVNLLSIKSGKWHMYFLPVWRERLVHDALGLQGDGLVSGSLHREEFALWLPVNYKKLFLQ